MFSHWSLNDTLGSYQPSGNLLHIGNSYITDRLYQDTEYEVRARGIIYEDVHLGELQSSSSTYS